jgi:hypothetical protein
MPGYLLADSQLDYVRRRGVKLAENKHYMDHLTPVIHSRIYGKNFVVLEENRFN